jgi:type III secretory pathway component EscV
MLFQCWRKKCGKVSTREKQRLGADLSEFQAGWVCPSLVLVVVVALTFAVLVPGMPLICAAYFALAYAVYGHQLLFVYIPRYALRVHV